MKEFPSDNGVAYRERNVAEDEEALNELLQKSGKRATPVITVDDEVVVGFDLGRLKSLLRI